MENIEKVEEINSLEFIKNLGISLDDKKKLLLVIASMVVSANEDAIMAATAACMGLSTSDEKFVAFYNRDILPTVNINVQTIYNQLADIVITDQTKYNDDLLNRMSILLGCDVDGDIIRVGPKVFYINAKKGDFEEIKEESNPTQGE